MINTKRSVVVLIAGLAVTSAVHARLLSVSGSDVRSPQSAVSCLESNGEDYVSSPYASSNAVEMPLWFVEFSGEVGTETKSGHEPVPALSLEGESSGLSVLLSTLISLGLCGSIHGTRKLHLGHIPDWLHNSGPFQIGYSYATEPELLSTPQICWLSRLVCGAEESDSSYRQKTPIPVWRKSQCTPCVLASRGPPIIS
jgi:hypothetical protein